MALSLEALKKKIEDAFASACYPGDDHIVNDGSRHYPLARRYRGRHWRELTFEDVFREPDPLAHFTPPAFAFFLPAILLASLTDDPRTRGICVDIVYHLGPFLSDATPDEFDVRIRDLTKEQREAVAHFLLYFHENDTDTFPSAAPTTHSPNSGSPTCPRVLPSGEHARHAPELHSQTELTWFGSVVNQQFIE
jgi:hypothetical protein